MSVVRARPLPAANNHGLKRAGCRPAPRWRHTLVSHNSLRVFIGGCDADTCRTAVSAVEPQVG